jgi:hypothetical protein
MGKVTLKQAIMQALESCDKRRVYSRTKVLELTRLYKGFFAPNAFYMRLWELRDEGFVELEPSPKRSREEHFRIHINGV